MMKCCPSLTVYGRPPTQAQIAVPRSAPIANACPLSSPPWRSRKAGEGSTWSRSRDRSLGESPRGVWCPLAAGRGTLHPPSVDCRLLALLAVACGRSGTASCLATWSARNHPGASEAGRLSPRPKPANLGRDGSRPRLFCPALLTCRLSGGSRLAIPV
jgi:hypothetical protein